MLLFKVCEKLFVVIIYAYLFFFQVLGTLFIYVLFMVEEFRKEPVENMDDVIYYVNGTYRLLEFLVALCVVAYGVSETIFGEWTVMGSMIIFIHSYYNVWLRAQLGWKSFLLRRDAVNKIKSLPIFKYCGSTGKESACNVGDLGSIPELGRSPGGGKGHPL